MNSSRVAKKAYDGEIPRKQPQKSPYRGGLINLNNITLIV